MKGQFNKVVGIGGIGIGMLFHTEINTTLGRNESRSVLLSDAKDYCKLHIVFYYISTLLKGKAEIYPIGCVGKDNFGKQLLVQMYEEGMNTSYVKTDEKLQTAISVSLQYPDKDGCNFTACNCAGGKVSPEYVTESMKAIHIDEKTMVVAIPEVPIESRIAMIQYGHEKGAFCALSVPFAEAEDFDRADIYRYCDLIAVNEEEARAICRTDSSGMDLAAELAHYLQKAQKDIMVLVTMGSIGAYSVLHHQIEFVPPYPSKVVNTTGAGDACLGGTISGLARNLPFQKGRDDGFFGETPLESAAELGTICAGMAIESEDSISKHVTINHIQDAISEKNLEPVHWFE